MRNFDNWNRYLDNNNKPLKGCIMFNVKDGNTVAPIFDSDNTPLDNPQITDIYGRTEHQVFIDTDVVAYFYKYIGTGDFTSIRSEDIDINDDTLWSLQYTSENINDVLKHISSDAATCVGTIAELRAIEIDNVPEVCGQKIITLLGYNQPGDKEPINYIWYPSLTDNDDNGAVIQGPELTGRWVMVKPTEHCDSRHYGIFPQNTTNFQGNTQRIEQFIAYCNSVNLRPYFSANGDYKYYKYNNLSFTIPVVDIAKDVTFLDTGTSNIWTTEFNGDPLFYNHATNLNSKEVKTSWGAYMFINPKHVNIDSDEFLFQTNYANCEVDLNVSTSKVLAFSNCTVNLNKSLGSISAFTNCIINSKNMISGGCYFTNCKLTEDMFYGSPYIHVDGNCIADFDDFEHKELMWLRIKDQQVQINYDWKGRLTQQNPWENVIDSDRWLINYKSTNVDAVLKESDNPHTYYIENCAGAITLQGKAANTYIFKNCEMIVKFAAGFNSGASIRLQDSTINVTQDRIAIANLNSQSSNLIGNGSFDVEHAYLYNTVQNVPVYCGYADVKDCNIGNIIQVYGIDQESEITVDTDPAATGTHTVYHVHRIVAGNFVNNFVANQIQIGTIDFNDPHYTAVDLVRGLSIVDNVGLYSDPIKINRSFSSQYDNYNVYTYKGNTGTMEMRTNGIVCTLVTSVGEGEAGLVINRGDAMYYAYTDHRAAEGVHVFQCRLFSIGTINVFTSARVEYSGNMANMGMMVGTLMYLTDVGEVYPNMAKASGDQFTWNIKNSVVTQGISSASGGENITFNVVQI